MSIPQGNNQGKHIPAIAMVLKKVEELERLCPGTRFHRDNLEALADGKMLPFRLDSPGSRGGIATFCVDLQEMGQTFDQWLDAELPRHAPSPDDARYNVICPLHGRVQIGKSGYDHQMHLPDARWICPLCGDVSEFDDDTYEAGGRDD